MPQENKRPFTPHWFKYIDTKNQPNYKLFNGGKFKSFINHAPFNSKVKIAYFLDGIFFPTTTGMAYHIMNILNALTEMQVDTYLFRCYRGWEDPKEYELFKFNTICIDPEVFYDDLSQVKQQLVTHNISAVVFDTAEVILLQGSFFKENLNLFLIQDVANVDPLISKKTGMNSTIVKKQEDEILTAEKYIDLYWTKTEKDSQQLIDLGVMPQKVRTTGVGIAIDNFKFRLRTSLAKPIKALYLGNMYYPPNIGGLPALEETCLKCNTDESILNIDVVGDGDVKSLSKEYPHLNFTGPLPDLAGLLDTYELAFACPSYGSGISLKILDYLASGIPIISNDVGIRGHDAEVLDCVILDNNAEFSSSVMRLLNEPKVYSALSINGRSYVKKRFDIKNNIESFVKDINQGL